jgi:L-asparaginase
MPTLVIHAGAGGETRPHRQHRIRAHLEEIGEACWPMLCEGRPAVEVVVEATRRLEDVAIFNAGLGSKLQADGVARLSAALMCGHRERFSGIVGLEGYTNPVLLCPSLQSAPDRVLMGEGARAWAERQGLPPRSPVTEERLAQWRSKVSGKTGTVGAVALDEAGRVAAAISTGGRGHEHVGRVSDSPTVAGNYATRAAAAGMTGIGEQIVDGGLAVRFVSLVEAGVSLEEAADRVMGTILEREWEVGFIAVDAVGNWVARASTWMGWRAYDSHGAHTTP